MSDSRKNSISRRSFLASTAAAGIVSTAGIKGIAFAEEKLPDLAVAKGKDAAKNAEAVIKAMGGMGKFVKKDQVVGILPNAQGTHKGCSTNNEITKAVVKACLAAGAKEVQWYTWLPERTWKRSNLKENAAAAGAKLMYIDLQKPELWKEHKVAKGKVLEQVKVMKAIDECDVFISMPIVKDHIGSRFTGSLKNYMGTSHATDNRKFHPDWKEDNVVRMEECVADLNTVVRKPDLIIMDAMEILTEKGPFGPGPTATPEKVIAGTDRVAIDSYGSTLLGLKGREVRMIRSAYEHGLGEIDLNKLNIKEMNL